MFLSKVSPDEWEDRSFLKTSSLYQLKKQIKEKPLSCAILAAEIALTLFGMAYVSSVYTQRLKRETIADSDMPLVMFIGVVGFCLFFIFKRALFGSMLDAEDNKIIRWKSKHSFTAKQDFLLRNPHPICLILEADNDYNFAFRDYDNYRSLRNRYSLVHMMVSSLDEMSEAIKKVSQIAPISLLWISAHGNPKYLLLGNNSYLHFNEVFKLKETFKLMQSNAKIVLHACLAAETNFKSRTNIAKRISIMAKDRWVFGSGKVIKSGDMVVSSGAYPKLSMINHDREGLRAYRNGRRSLVGSSVYL